LVDNRWYSSLSSNAFLEGEYENLILSRAKQMFPEFFAVNFRKLVQNEHDAKIPDFALIDKAYSSWWIVEVELSHHSFDQHVLPQVSVFATSAYGRSDAEYLQRQDPSLDLSRLREMMRGNQPKVLVIVNTPMPKWKEVLSGAGVLLAIAEVFRSEIGKNIIRVNGDYPRGPEDETVLSLCQFDKAVPTFLVVSSPARLPSTEDDRYWIEYEGSVMEWVKSGLGDRVWLCPGRAANPLPRDRSTIQLIQLEDNRLTFKTT
jgi:hypothetical protein